MPSIPSLTAPVPDALQATVTVPSTSGDDALPRWPSQVLLADGREAAISHAGMVYRLRLTALGKLILTK